MKNLFILMILISITEVYACHPEDTLLNNKFIITQNAIEKQLKSLESLEAKINKNETNITRLNNTLADVTLKITILNSTSDSLSTLIETNRSNINTIADDLGTKIQETGEQAETRISELGSDVEKNRLYWIIATLVTLLLGALMYLFLGKRIKSSQTDVETQIRNTKKSLEEESLKLDNKLIEVLETQLKAQQEESKNQPIATNDKADHSLALKVADEIVRIHKNLQQMDSNTKGLKQLSASVKRIQDNFASNGYELVEMLGKEYNEGMKVIANFVPSEDIETGKQIITRIIKPQVNYKNEMIQSAQIEVSVGE